MFLTVGSGIAFDDEHGDSFQDTIAEVVPFANTGDVIVRLSAEVCSPEKLNLLVPWYVAGGWRIARDVSTRIYSGDAAGTH